MWCQPWPAVEVASALERTVAAAAVAGAACGSPPVLRLTRGTTWRVGMGRVLCLCLRGGGGDSRMSQPLRTPLGCGGYVQMRSKSAAALRCQSF
jgi:hypothetical protein